MNNLKTSSGFFLALALMALSAFVPSCGTQKKMTEIKTEQMRANIALPKEREADFRQFDASDMKPKNDTIVIKGEDGQDIFFMKTIVVDGEEMASEQLEAAIVTARFRNIAERHGKIDLEFDVIVPKKMMDSKWKLRFDPDMFIMGDSTRLEPVFITGREYRQSQERGEELFARYLRSIVADTTAFQWTWQLDIFLERNIPQVFAFANDTSMVDVDTFDAIRIAQERDYKSKTGISVKTAIFHYTNWLARHHNDWKIRRIGKMKRRYIKDPIVKDGIRLDTIIQEVNGDFLYRYVQTVTTRPKLRKIDIVLSGNILEAGRPVYNIPPCDPLTFYISSVASFVSDENRYLTKVIERKAEANTSCHIEFAVGKSDIDLRLGDNRSEIARIGGNLRDILNNTKFDLDSITVAAYASPEGRVSSNNKLSAKRAEATGRYFGRFLTQLQDSLKRESGMTLVIGEDGSDSGMQEAYQMQDIKFLSHSGGEGWTTLDYLVDTDTLYNNETKEEYFSIVNRYADLDVREGVLKKKAYYKDMKARLYPHCRLVTFDFHMHRKGMIKDTVHTTVLDSVYMSGVQAIRDRDYEAAIALLHPYQDYNCAVAYIALDRNASAKRILEKLPRTPQIDYLMAILWSREGEDQKAVQCYMDACKADRAYVSRGNLDPEISVLIKRYGLNKEPEDDLDLF